MPRTLALIARNDRIAAAMIAGPEEVKRTSSMTGLLRIGACIAALLFAGGGRAPDAATYHNHPVKVIVPFAAAVPTDVIARMLAQKLTERLGQQFYVENHP